MRGEVSSCGSCASANKMEFASEICIHFPGLKGLDKAPILAFPKLVICLDCGFVQSNLSAQELRLLRDGASGGTASH
jgi:hypothetical protein